MMIIPVGMDILEEIHHAMMVYEMRNGKRPKAIFMNPSFESELRAVKESLKLTPTGKSLFGLPFYIVNEIHGGHFCWGFGE